MTTASTTITCTKSQFAAKLRAEYLGRSGRGKGSGIELGEVIAGLVQQARAHSGVFTGHSAYLDLDFIVEPDEPTTYALDQRVMLDGRVMIVCSVPPGNGKPDTYGVQPPACACKRPFGTTWVGAEELSPIDGEPITIPAVTDAQRDEHRGAARTTIRNVADTLRAMLAEYDLATPEELDTLAGRLTAAAGHLRIADPNIYPSQRDSQDAPPAGHLRIANGE